MAGAEVVYRLRVSAHDLAAALDIATDFVAPLSPAEFEGRREALARYLAARLAVAAEGKPCAPAPPAIDVSALPADLVLVARYECPAAVARLGLRYDLFFDLDPAHRSLGEVVLPGGTTPFVFDRSVRRLDLDVTAPAPTGRFARIVGLGVEHILTGYDHLLFLLALLIGATRLGAVVRIVTAFTAAHSVTLALAWFGVVALPARPVEVAIAASIAWVALENALGRPAHRRWLLAGGFGLVHGLGFYGALRDLGLGGAGALTTLVAFNLGVELGQVGLVTLAWAPLAWWTRRSWFRSTARVGSAAILLVAIWLAIQRA